MATKAQFPSRTKLTGRQVAEVRASMMKTAALIGNQLHRYIEDGKLVIGKNEIEITPSRLAAWKLVLDRTVPTLSASEITHKSGLESMDSGKLIGRLVELTRQRPELATKLQDALGIRVIQGEHETIPDSEVTIPVLGRTDESREAMRSPDSPPAPQEPVQHQEAQKEA